MKNVFTFANLRFFSLILLAVSLPLSVFTTSLAEILLMAGWLAEGGYAVKFRLFRERPALWFITSLYLLHLLGLLYTTDFSYALHDLRIKLPVLILPLVLGTTPGPGKKPLRTILLFFTAATMVSGLISFLVFQHVIPIEYYDIRDISIFVSHIRLALMVCLAVFILFYYLFTPDAGMRLTGRMRILAFSSAAWLIFFLYVLKSFTGLIVFLVVSLILAWYRAGRIARKETRIITRILLLAVPLLIASWVTSCVSRYYTHDRVDFSRLEERTANGNPYFHDTLSQATENGHYVWLYVSTKELKSCWNRRSDYPFEGKDKRGQELRYTLIRYLTSKGLRKDCEGVNALTAEDVKAVENGKANCIFLRRYSLYPRVYQIIWEFDRYSMGGSPSGHSITQRVAYLGAAWGIIRHHFLIGVGTGDVQKAFNTYYEEHHSRLRLQNRRRAHNQFVTFFVTFGLVGFVAAMWAIFAPVFYERKWSDYLFMVFFLTGLLSMLNEDTLETQTGVSFFMFFYALLLFRPKKEKPPAGLSAPGPKIRAGNISS